MKGYTARVLSVLLPTSDPALNDLARAAAQTSIAAIAPKALPEDVGIAFGVVDRTAGRVQWGGFNEVSVYYPASTIKLFWLAYAQRRIVDRRLATTPEIDRAMHDMIVDSSNVATNVIVEASTRAIGGPDLPPDELKRWMEKRQAANRWYAKLRYTGVNVRQKVWDEGPTGREIQALGPNRELRNSLSPFAGMRLLSEVMLGRIVSPEACLYMRELLHRTRPDDEQVRDFTGGQLGPGCELWSKAGWMSTTKCDLAWIKAPDGREVVLSVFTVNSARDERLMPRIARELLLGLKIPVRNTADR